VFVKCSPNPHDPGVTREALALQHLAALKLPHLRLPRIHAFDPRGQVLALRWIGAPSLYAARRRLGVQSAQYLELGRALGSLHRGTEGATLAWAAPPEETLLDCFIWTRPAFATRLPPDGMRLFGTVQGDRAALEGLLELALEPQAGCLIHGDAKELNVLLPRGGPVLLDWELAQLGDPAQDLGSLLADLARCAIAPEAPEERLSAAAFRSARDAFLRGHRELAGPPDARTRRRIRLWMGAHLLIYAHAMVLSDGVLHALPWRLLQRARVLLRGGRRG
jgi:tRNA A-37 threonylcarbamoyl transferase component Bud32